MSKTSAKIFESECSQVSCFPPWLKLHTCQAFSVNSFWLMRLPAPEPGA